MNIQYRKRIEMMLRKGDSTRHVAETLGINRTTVSAIKTQMENANNTFAQRHTPTAAALPPQPEVNGNSIDYVPKQPEKFYHTKGTTVSEHRTRR